MDKKKFLIYIIILVIGILAGINVISAFKSNSHIDPYKHDLDSLKTVLNANIISQTKANTKIKEFEFKIQHLDSQIILQQNKIEKLKTNEANKIKNVDNSSVDELYSSITNRYTNRYK